MLRKSWSERVTVDGKRHPQGAFEISYVAREEDLLGRMQPEFKPHYWVQYLRDGTSEFFMSKNAALAWLKEWKEIGQ